MECRGAKGLVRERRQGSLETLRKRGSAEGGGEINEAVAHVACYVLNHGDLVQLKS